MKVSSLSQSENIFCLECLLGRLVHVLPKQARLAEELMPYHPGLIFFFKSQAKNMNNSNWTSGRQSSVNWEKAKQCPVFNILPYFRKAILNSNPSQFFITQKTHFCFISQAVLPVLLCHRLLIPLEMISSLSWKV